MDIQIISSVLGVPVVSLIFSLLFLFSCTVSFMLNSQTVSVLVLTDTDAESAKTSTNNRCRLWASCMGHTELTSFSVSYLLGWCAMDVSFPVHSALNLVYRMQDGLLHRPKDDEWEKSGGNGKKAVILGGDSFLTHKHSFFKDFSRIHPLKRGNQLRHGMLMVTEA